jgi:hypothetical protein
MAVMSVTPYPPTTGANPASGLDGTCDMPMVIHGKPVKIEPRTHSKAVNVAAT